MTGLCATCLKTPPFFNQVHAPYLYAPPLNKLITGLKFRQQLHHARVLGHLLLNHIKKVHSPNTAHPKPQCLVPVPLHPVRLRERGYNQALEIARPLAKSLNIKLEKNICQRIKPTAPQTDLKLKDRKANLRHAFHINTIRHYRHIAIIDDVITTGHTVQELARSFQQAGIETIEIWAIARVKLEK